MQGNVMQKSVSDGKDYVQIQMGQKAPQDAATKEKNLFDAHLVPETMIAAMNVKVVLKSIESLEGKEAYVVEYMFPAGEKIINYFDKDSGLKVQTIEQAKTPQGEISVPTKLQDYKEVGGVKLAHSILISQGPMVFKFQVSTAEANPTLDDALFKVQ